MIILWLYMAFSYGFMLHALLNEGEMHWLNWVIFLLSPITIFVYIYCVFKERML